MVALTRLTICITNEITQCVLLANNKLVNWNCCILNMTTL